MHYIPLILLVLAVIVFVFLFRAVIHIVREYQRLVVFRLGRCIGQRGPGFVALIPIIDQPTNVDLREQFLQIPHQTCITKDNAPISIDFLIYSRVEDPVLSVVRVQNFAGAVQGMATTNLRAVVGDLSLDDVLAKRDQINQILATKLDEVTEGWGVKVTRVEIREVVPPREVSDAMIRQMSAERSRRALVTEAEGTRSAAITVAEGEKQSAILRAEGQRQAQALVAEGFALALQTIFAAAHTVDTKTMVLQYLETLKSIGQGPSSTFIIPAEFTNLLRPILDHIGQAMDGGEG